jgi:hypothetical protein
VITASNRNTEIYVDARQAFSQPPPANFCDERSTEMLDQQLGKDLDLSHGVLSWWPHDK